MRVLAFGSRTFNDRFIVTSTLQGLYEVHTLGFLTLYVDEFTVISGEAAGADTLAKEWAVAPGPHPATCDPDNRDICHVYYEGWPAEWGKYGKRAGPLRNTQMLESLLMWGPHDEPEAPELRIGVGFVDKPLAETKGSLNMAAQLRAAGVTTYIVEAS